MINEGRDVVEANEFEDGIIKRVAIRVITRVANAWNKYAEETNNGIANSEVEFKETLLESMRNDPI